MAILFVAALLHLLAGIQAARVSARDCIPMDGSPYKGTHNTAEGYTCMNWSESKVSNEWVTAMKADPENRNYCRQRPGEKTPECEVECLRGNSCYIWKKCWEIDDCGSRFDQALRHGEWKKQLIWYQNPNTDEHDRLPIHLKNIAIGSRGIWMIDINDKVWRSDHLMKIPRKMKDIEMKDISVGSEVYGIGTEGYTIHKDGKEVYGNVYRWKSADWEMTEGVLNGDWEKIGGTLTNIAVSEKGHVWGINEGGNIYYRRKNDEWKIVYEKKLSHPKQITVGKAGVWMVDDEGKVWYLKGTQWDPDTLDKIEWTDVSGEMVWLASGKGIVIGVNKYGKVYHRAGITEDNPKGSRWVLDNSQKLDGIVDVYKKIAVGVYDYGNKYEGYFPQKYLKPAI